MIVMERWRWVPGYESRYAVSDLGRVLSMRSGQPVLLKPEVHTHGYHRVTFGTRRYYVHILVLTAFVGPCPVGMVTRHLHGDPSDNRLSQLAWGTLSENGLDMVRHGTHQGARKIHCAWGHRLVAPNLRRCRAVKGRRGCLACHRTDTPARRARALGLPFDFQAESDLRYDTILKGLPS